MCCFHSDRLPVHVTQPLSHAEPPNQGRWAGRGCRRSAREADTGKGSTWAAQSGYKTITTGCLSPGDTEGWTRQVAVGALALGVPRPSALWTMRAGYNGVN